MDSPFMARMASLLAGRGITVVRFEFAYMAARRLDGRRRPPNPQASLLQQWRALYRQLTAELARPLAIGGKSMGGRMASLLADELAADALVCLGYPFHPPGKPDRLRVAHLAELQTRTLIVQGERDRLGSRAEVEQYQLSDAVSLHWLATADHDLKPLRASGRSHDEALEEAAAAIARFLLEPPAS